MSKYESLKENIEWILYAARHPSACVTLKDPDGRNGRQVGASETARRLAEDTYCTVKEVEPGLFRFSPDSERRPPGLSIPKDNPHIEVMDAQQATLTPAILAATWCMIPDHRRDGLKAYMSKQRHDALVCSSSPSLCVLDEKGFRIAGVPVAYNVYMPDDLVSIMDTDGRIYAQIKNMARPS